MLGEKLLSLWIRCTLWNAREKVKGIVCEEADARVSGLWLLTIFKEFFVYSYRNKILIHSS